MFFLVHSEEQLEQNHTTHVLMDDYVTDKNRFVRSAVSISIKRNFISNGYEFRLTM